MQLWFRRPTFFRFYVASLGLAVSSQAIQAQQTPSNGTAPAFRLTAPVGKPATVSNTTISGPQEPSPSSGLVLSEPPNLRWPAAKEDSKDLATDEANLESEDTRGVLMIGSASTRLVSGNDDEPSVFEDVGTSAREFDDSILVAIMELAQAGFAHASPLYRALASPLMQGFTDEPPTSKTAARAPARLASSKKQLDPTDASDTDDKQEELADSNANEPPRLPIDDVTFEAMEPELTTIPEDETGAATKEESLSDGPSKRGAVSEPDDSSSSRRPTPRTVKMPFDNSPLTVEPTPKSSLPKVERPNESKSARSLDPDSQKEQEEPAIETVPRGNDKELQGVDALQASKPGLHRREIRIEDNGRGQVVPPVVPKVSLPPDLDNRLKRSQACVDHYLRNPESTSVRSPWAVMHAVLAYGADYELIHGAGRVNAIGWMCHNGTCRTQRMFTPKGKGFVPNVGGGVQGHEGQFLAILAQCNVPLDYPIQIGAAKYKVEDLVRYEMATCKEKSELTFKLIGLSYYLDSNKQWRANDGQVWSIPKLIQEELAQPIIGSACGGTHRLMGFSFSVRQRQLQNEPINGQYARAAKFVREYVPYTLQLQNPDGSFSTNWYEGRANEPNDERKVQTSGHMMEWLLYTMTDEEVQQPRIAKGIDFLLSRIYDQRDRKWPIGPRGHATRAIALYHARMNELVGTTGTLPPTSTAASKPAQPTRTQPAARQTAAPIIRK
jgi:hypothetical protein